MEPQQDESGIDTYGADEGDEFSGTEYELYTVLENRVKEAMLAGNEWVSIKDLKIRRDTYDLSFYYAIRRIFRVIRIIESLPGMVMHTIQV